VLRRADEDQALLAAHHELGEGDAAGLARMPRRSRVTIAP